jgi:nitrite reductase (NADH) small subunit
LEVVLGPASAFPQGRFRVVAVAGREIGVTRTAAGAVYAVRNSCPHRGAPVCMGTFGGTMLPSPRGVLSYGLEEEVLRCPWHGWEFDLGTGRALFGTASRRLVTYPAALRGGEIVLTLPDGGA